MAANDFTDIVQRSLYLARRNVSNAHALARGQELVNEWHRSTCDSGHDWTFLKREVSIPLTAGTSTFSFATVESALSLSGGQLREILTLAPTYDDAKPLTRLEWDELEAMARSTQDSDARGVPVFYARINNTIRVYPTPEQAVTLFALCRIQPIQLSGVQTFLTPDAWTPRLAIPYVASRLLWADGSRDALALADRLQSQYDKDFDSFIAIWSSEDEELRLKSPTAWEDLDLSGADYYSSAD